MADDQDVVIVGTDGTEHVFPPGFDPKRAAGIVRHAEATTPPPQPAPAVSRAAGGAPVVRRGHEAEDAAGWATLQQQGAGEFTDDPSMALGKVYQFVKPLIAGAGSVVQKAGAVTKALGMPLAKYELTKHGLKAMGVPSEIADLAALGVSGYSRGTPAAAPVKQGVQAARGAAAKAPTVTAATETAVTSAAPMTTIATPKALTLVPRPLKEAVAIVRQAAPTAKLKLTATEFQAATALVKEGYSGDAVLNAIAQQRAVALKASSAFANLPTEAEVLSDVAARNATGRWGAGPVTK
mgnify:CR=1 FL=1